MTEEESLSGGTTAPPLPLEGFKLNNKPTDHKQNDIMKPALNTIDLIIPNLYLGDISAAYDVEDLKQKNITHVLTINDNSLDEEQYEHLEKYKFKKLADHQYSNILDVMDDCLEFIDEAIKDSKNILVHCFAGMSRSATLVLAYIMAKEKQSIKKTLDQVRKIRFVKPNMGFYKQLELFQAMDFKVSKESPIFRTFKYENMAKQIQLGNQFKLLEQKFEDKLGKFKDINDNEDTTCYKCKKCRYYLFPANKIISHIKYDSSMSTWNKRIVYYKKLGSSVTAGNTELECKAELYIEPLDWFKDNLEEMDGKLNCPKCDTKIGSFDWRGSICSCKTWVTPAFHISPSKVDVCKPLHESIVKADPKLLLN